MILVGLKEKCTGVIVEVHKLGEMYVLPTGYDSKELEVVSIEVPEKDISGKPPEDLKDFICPECGNKPDYFSACCVEKANGFRGKFSCPQCNFIVYLKEE